MMREEVSLYNATIKTFGKRLNLCEKLESESIKGEDKYIQGNLKTWKEHIKTNFHGQDILKVDSVYKQSKNCHPKVYI